MPVFHRVQRLLYYGNELSRLCEEVRHELMENRRRRREWFRFTDDWKRRWLARNPDGAVLYSARPERRFTVSIIEERVRNSEQGEKAP